jgi:chromosome segregation ATPase
MGHRKWSLFGAGAESMEGAMREHNELYDEWKASERRVMETLDENNRLDRELDEARKRIAELEAPTRVPFNDAQIERMAEAAHTRRMRDEERTTTWKDLPLFAKNAWRHGIRAALAAGGLEPCAVPEYDPDDVAHSTPIIADLHKQLEAARREVDEVRRHISVTMSREHQARKEAQEVKQQADEYLRMYENEQKNTEHWKAKAALADATVAALRDEADEDNANAASVNDLLVQVQNLTAERNVFESAATKALAERDRLAAENAELWSSRPTETAYLDLSNRQLIIDYEQALKGLAAADATLDRLREVVPKVLPPHMSWKDSLDGARAILNPENET